MKKFDRIIWDVGETIFGCSCARLMAFPDVRKGVQMVRIVGPEYPLEGIVGRPKISGIRGDFRKTGRHQRAFFIRSVRVEGEGWVEAHSVLDQYRLPTLFPCASKQAKGE